MKKIYGDLSSDCEKNRESLERLRHNLTASFENSHEWIETLTISVGFYLLAVMAKAPEEIEVLGVKINMEGDLSSAFLLLMTVALIFRIVQRIILWVISEREVSAILEDVGRNLDDAGKRLEDLSIESKGELKSAIEYNATLQDAPDVYSLFLPPDLTLEQEEYSTESQFSEIMGKQINENWSNLVSKKLDHLFPKDLWDSASKLAISLYTAEKSQQYRPQPLFISPTDNPIQSDAAPALERIKLLRAEFKRERDLLERSVQNKLNPMQNTEALKSYIGHLGKILGDLRFYRHLIKFGRIFNLAIPVISLAIFIVGVVNHR